MPPYWSLISGVAEISFIIISFDSRFVKHFFENISEKFGNTVFEVIYLHFRRFLLIFLAGGVIYVCLEVLWRGRSHWSMFLAGGICLLLVGHLQEVQPRLPLPFRILAGVGIITMTELAFGLAVNRDFSVWDYRDAPGNWLGQICPGFMLLWLPLSWSALMLYDRLKERT